MLQQVLSHQFLPVEKRETYREIVRTRNLDQIRALPPETVIYSGHEYTQANADFALTIEPGNAALQARAQEVRELRAKGEPTVPTTLARELETNVFLRPDSAEIQANTDMEGREDWEIFGEVRSRKDNA